MSRIEGDWLQDIRARRRKAERISSCAWRILEVGTTASVTALILPPHWLVIGATLLWFTGSFSLALFSEAKRRFQEVQVELKEHGRQEAKRLVSIRVKERDAPWTNIVPVRDGTERFSWN